MKKLRNLIKLSMVSVALGCTHYAFADFVVNDDLIVDGSACIGFDCVNGEAFGFDTIRIKENNLRIKADDTSVAASFPRNDWQLTFNDSANGGLSKFSVDDITGGRTPFTIEAGAPTHSLYVDDGGRLGIRTSTPSVEIHTVSGDTPTLRLQQDGSSGFAPQSWDVAGNETNFFVRDVTNGSTLPLRIRPGAPSSAIDISDEGYVGMGTASPDMPVHVFENTGGIAGLLHLENNGGSFIEIEKTGGDSWVLAFENAAAGRFLINHSTGGGSVAAFTDTGDLTLKGGLITGTAGSCEIGTPCDGVFRPDEFTVESIEDHASFMWENQHLKAVGPTLKGEPFNVTRKSTSILHELEVAHIYIEQLNNQIKELKALHEHDEI